MKRRNLPPNSNKEKVKRERDPLPWRYCFLTVVCGLILVGGFFYAARQHFSAMDYGIKNAKLRQQKENLQSEQRRLYLTREISLSPAEIKKAAKKIGLHEFTTGGIEYVSHKIASVNPLAEKVTKEKTKAAFAPDKENKESKENKENKKQLTKQDKETKSKESSVAASSGDVRPRVAKK